MASAVEAIFTADNSQYTKKIAELDNAAKDFAKKQKQHADEQHAQFEREMLDLDEKVKRQRKADQEISDMLLKKKKDQEKKIIDQENALYPTKTTSSQNEAVSNIEKAHGHVSGLNLVLRETLVIFREIGRGNWARVPVSLTLVLQGLYQMRESLGMFGAIFSLTGAAVVAGLGAIAYGAYKVYEHFKLLSDRVKDAGNAFGMARITMEEFNNALKKNSNATQEFINWQHSLANATETVGEKTERLLKRMKERFELENKLAKLRHESPTQEVARRQAELQKELDLIEKAKDAAYEKLKSDKASADAINKEIASKGFTKTIAQANQQEAQAALSAKMIDQIKEKIPDIAGYTFKELESMQERGGENATALASRDVNKMFKDASGQEHQYSVHETYQAKVSDLLTDAKNREVKFEVDGKKYLMSLNQATLEMNAANSETKKLTAEQEDLRNKLKNAQSAVEKGRQGIQTLAHLESENLSQQSNIPTDMKIAIAEREAGMKGYGLNAQQRIGAYAATPPDFKMLIAYARQTAENTKKEPQQRTPAPMPPRYSSGARVGNQ